VVTATALVPLLSLGIPGSNSAAVLLGGFLVHGLQPGPMLFEKAPHVVYGLYAGLLVANIAMVLIGLVILTPCIWLVNRPKPWLIAFILALVVSGVYSVHQSLFEVGLVLGIGALATCCAWWRAHAAAGAGRGAGLHDRVQLPAAACCCPAATTPSSSPIRVSLGLLLAALALMPLFDLAGTPQAAQRAAALEETDHMSQPLPEVHGRRAAGRRGSPASAPARRHRCSRCAARCWSTSPASASRRATPTSCAPPCRRATIRATAR
jgi:hypothetical protein